MNRIKKTFIKFLAALVPMGVAVVNYSPKVRSLIFSALEKTGDLQHVVNIGAAALKDESALTSNSKYKFGISGKQFKSQFSNTKLVLIANEGFGASEKAVRLKIAENFPLNQLEVIQNNRKENLLRELSDARGQNNNVCLVMETETVDTARLSEFMQIMIQNQAWAFMGYGLPVVQSQAPFESLFLSSSAINDVLERESLFSQWTDLREFYELLRSQGVSIEKIQIQEKESHLEEELRNILVVQPVAGGGTKKISDKILNLLENSFNVFVLSANLKEFVLSQIVDGKLVECFRTALHQELSPFSHASTEYDSHFQEIVRKYKIQKVHVEHLVWQSLSAFEICKPLGITISHSLHDFYDICPSYMLLDESLKPCYGRCSATVGQCETTLWPRYMTSDLKSDKVFDYRKDMLKFISTCDDLVYPDQSVEDQFSKIYGPSLPRGKIIPHASLLEKFTKPESQVYKSGKIRVLVLGDISLAKGALKIQEIHNSDSDNLLELHFLGRPWSGLVGIGKHHGKYDHSEMDKIIGKIRPHVAILPGPFGETFSLTLSELWSVGIPTLVADQGALASRSLSSGCGELIEYSASGTEWLSSILEFVSSPDRYTKAIENLLKWQEQHLASEEIERMAKEYTEVFNR